MNNVLAKHKVNAHVLAYVKDKGKKISTITFALTFVVSYEIWGCQNLL
jgi:hypothetical protein